MAFLALFLAFAIGALLSPFIWVVLIPSLVAKAKADMEDAMRKRRETAELLKEAEEAVRTIDGYREQTEASLATSRALYAESQELVKKMTINHSIITKGNVS